jgi:hypothetical protein
VGRVLIKPAFARRANMPPLAAGDFYQKSPHHIIVSENKMFYMRIILYVFIIWQILMLPCHFAGLNEKSAYDVARVRIACLAFGWTIVGYLWALWIALAPKNRE